MGRTNTLKVFLAGATSLSMLALASQARAEPPHSSLAQHKAQGFRSFRGVPGAYGQPALRARFRASHSNGGLLRFVAFGPAPAYSFTAKSATVQRGPGFECRAHCNDGRITNSHSLEVASRVLAGIAGAAVATGVALCFAQATSSERVGLVPVLRLKLAGDRAIASAGWEF